MATTNTTATKDPTQIIYDLVTLDANIKLEYTDDSETPKNEITVDATINNEDFSSDMITIDGSCLSVKIVDFGIDCSLAESVGSEVTVDCTIIPALAVELPIDCSIIGDSFAELSVDCVFEVPFSIEFPITMSVGKDVYTELFVDCIVAKEESASIDIDCIVENVVLMKSYAYII